jgi:hypothetical protein
MNNLVKAADVRHRLGIGTIKTKVLNFHIF